MSNKGSKEGTKWLGMLDRERKKRTEMCESIADNGFPQGWTRADVSGVKREGKQAEENK